MKAMIDLKGVKRFAKYTAIGGTTFLFDLLLIWTMVEAFDLSYPLATALGFIVAVTLNYFISRRFVFRGTAREIHHGYFYFIGLACLGAFVVTGAVSLLVTFFALHYLMARVLVACVMGSANYLLNLHFNFKVVGLHH